MRSKQRLPKAVIKTMQEFEEEYLPRYHKEGMEASSAKHTKGTGLAPRVLQSVRKEVTKR